jgi:hypothetical protein
MVSSAPVRTTLTLLLLLVSTLAVGGAGCGAEEGTFLECYHPGACPGADSECARRTCEAGRCGMRMLQAGTVLVQQFTGDCRLGICDGAGAAIYVPDDSDFVRNRDTPCIINACTAGTPTSSLVPPGSPCLDRNSSAWGLCDGTGVCVL